MLVAQIVDKPCVGVIQPLDCFGVCPWQLFFKLWKQPPMQQCTQQKLIPQRRPPPKLPFLLPLHQQLLDFFTEQPQLIPQKVVFLAAPLAAKQLLEQVLFVGRFLLFSELFQRGVQRLCGWAFYRVNRVIKLPQFRCRQRSKKPFRSRGHRRLLVLNTLKETEREERAAEEGQKIGMCQ